jgi:ribosomal RNA-processing protein 12
MKEFILNTELRHFREVMIPLAFRMKTKADGFEKQGKMLEFKTYQSVYEQIWSLLPNYCNYSIDLIEVNY